MTLIRGTEQFKDFEAVCRIINRKKEITNQEAADLLFSAAALIGQMCSELERLQKIAGLV